MDEETKQVPVGVKIIAFLYSILGTGVFFGFGVVGMFISLRELLSNAGGTIASEYAALLILGLVYSILSIGFAVLCFFIGRGLFRAKRWARITVIVIQTVGILFGLFYIFKGNIFLGIESIVISGIIGGYLLFSRRVKEAFNNISLQ